jgi:choline dehydrogenase-like flavoprotein
MARRDGFDTVIVGGGAAGCVLARRLSEDGDRSVLLLEAGPDLRDATPREFRDGWRLPTIPDWGLQTEPDGAGGTQKLRRGRVLGGTSWLTRFAVRGAASDFDAWAAGGNPGWSFEDVLPDFRRLENDADYGDRPLHHDHDRGTPHCPADEASLNPGTRRVAPWRKDHGPGSVPSRAVFGATDMPLKCLAAISQCPHRAVTPTVGASVDWRRRRIRFRECRAGPQCDDPRQPTAHRRTRRLSRSSSRLRLGAFPRHPVDPRGGRRRVGSR